MPSNRMGGINRPDDDGPMSNGPKGVGHWIGSIWGAAILVATAIVGVTVLMVVVRLSWLASTYILGRMGAL